MAQMSDYPFSSGGSRTERTTWLWRSAVFACALAGCSPSPPTASEAQTAGAAAVTSSSDTSTGPVDDATNALVAQQRGILDAEDNERARGLQAHEMKEALQYRTFSLVERALGDLRSAGAKVRSTDNIYENISLGRERTGNYPLNTVYLSKDHTVRVIRDDIVNVTYAMIDMDGFAEPPTLHPKVSQEFSGQETEPALDCEVELYLSPFDVRRKYNCRELLSGQIDAHVISSVKSLLSDGLRQSARAEAY